MKPRFEVIFLEEAREFLLEVDEKAQSKIIYNIDKARFLTDPKLFKKLNKDIGEFRTVYKNTQYRLLAFWDKREGKNTLVVATHGLVKKRDKVPSKEIDKATALMNSYFST